MKYYFYTGIVNSIGISGIASAENSVPPNKIYEAITTALKEEYHTTEVQLLTFTRVE